MWHVAEGDLHAYLDGALTAYPVEQADRIREHLEQCEECRGKLREEEELRERAGGILALTDVGTLEPPPFGEIRQRAQVRGGQAVRSGPSRVGMRLGWAASVALALGTGWMLGRGPGAVPQGSLAEPTVPSETLASDDEVRAAASAEAGRRVAVEGAAAEMDVTTAPARDPLQPARLAEAERREAAERAFTDGSRPPAEALAGAAATAMEVSDEVIADADLERAAAEAPTAIAAEPMAPSPPIATPGGARNGLGSNAAVALREGSGADETSGPALPANMLVPGLPVLQVRWTELVPGVDGLVVQQRLVQDTTVLELRFLGLDRGVSTPAGEPSSLFGPLPEGVNQVVLPLVGEFGWVALRGRLPRDRLERLLDLLR